MFRNQVSISLLTFFSSFCFRYPLQCWPYPFCWTRSPRSETKMQKNLQLVSQLFGTFTLKCIPAFFLLFPVWHTYQKRNFTSICMLFLDCIIHYYCIILQNVICVQKENICFENKLLLLGNPDGYLTTQKCMEENTPQCLICIDYSSPVVHRDKEQIQ